MKLLIKRLFATAIDMVVLFLFTILIWAVIENSSGLLFSHSFFNENSFIENIFYLLSIFLPLSFFYFLGAGINQGYTVGKALLNLKIDPGNDKYITNPRLLMRELFWKWGLCIVPPLIIFFTNASLGLYSIAIIFIAYLAINFIMWVLKKKTFVDIFSRTRVSKLINEKHIHANHAFLSLSALIIDLNIVLTICLIFYFLLQGIWYIQFFHLFFIILFLYFFVVGLINVSSIGKYYLGIHIIGKNEKINRKSILQREVLYKYGLVIIVPLLLLNLLGIVDPFHIFLNIFTFVGLALLLYFTYTGKTWWSKMAGTTKLISPLPKRRVIIIYLAILLFWGCSFTFIRHKNNSTQDAKVKILGFHFPFNYPERPNSQKVNKYYEFLSNQRQSPKEYIIGLFKEYDIVIICETYHGESTQWEMIYDVVSDDYFIDNVGNIFTEYGSAMHQEKIDTFLFTTFKHDTLLEKATASLMDYMSGGFYYFIKNVNKLNSRLTDSLKIREHYTDICDWDYLARYSRFSIPNIEMRDSLMAQVTIDWFKNKRPAEKRKKCLVVTNYRHAFGYAGGVEYVKNNSEIPGLTSHNQGQYIFESFPDQTACIVQNCPNNQSKSFFVPIISLINNGIWENAFQQTNYKPVGFDLEGSPFGEDVFDMYPTGGAKLKLRYQDIFTGVVFNKPYTEMKNIDYPYKRYAFEQEYKKKYPQIDTLELQKELTYYSDNAYTDDTMRWALSISIANFLGIFFFLLLSSISFIIVSYHLIRNLKFH